MATATAFLGGCASASLDAGTSVFETSSLSSGYRLSAAEQAWNCNGLENAIEARSTRIAALEKQAKAEIAQAPPTVSRLFTRLFEGNGKDSPAQRQLQSERAAADAYAATLRSKGCPPMDVEASIAKAEAELAAKPVAILPPVFPETLPWPGQATSLR
jgi:hypothetical protein